MKKKERLNKSTPGIMRALKNEILFSIFLSA
jgi:hypothetical protein